MFLMQQTQVCDRDDLGKLFFLEHGFNDPNHPDAPEDAAELRVLERAAVRGEGPGSICCK